jgi:hypothetical protein
MDYSAFDSFLARDTWHTSHPLDDREFYRCLRTVVELPDFSPDKMGDYIRGVKGVISEDHHFAKRVDDLVGNAWAVQEYLRVNR